MLQEEFEEARVLYYKSLEGLDQKDDLNNSHTSYFNIAIANYYLDNLDSVEVYVNRSLAGAKQANDIVTQTRVYNFMAALSEDNKTKLAYVDSSIYLARTNGLIADLIDFLENKTTALEEAGRYQEAYDILWDAKFYKDTIYNKQTSTALALNVKYASAQKDLEIKNLEIKRKETELKNEKFKSDQNRMYFGIIVLLGLLLVVSLRFFDVKKTKNILREKNSIITKEKDKSDELLLNILPSEVAEELKEKGYGDARDFENATVLFTDFKEFTNSSSVLPAKELVKEVNTYFKKFDEIVEKHGVEKIKTIGDAYMAAGGIHNEPGSEILNVVHAALEMQDYMIQHKEECIKADKHYFDMRVGINTGPVVAGIVGVKKFQYDIWGDTVNIANRMESNGKVGKVNISESTYIKIKDNADFFFEKRIPKQVKGKGLMSMWFVSRV